MSGIESILRTLSGAASAKPRLTHYDTQDGVPERIELSGRVLLNWVSKAANLLREEFDAEPGTRVELDLPAAHWRAAYWALAIWAVGATLVVPTRDSPGSDAWDPDIVISASPGSGQAWPPRVVVTLAALARRHPDVLPPGTFDEAAVLSTYGDVFEADASPGEGDVALLRVGATVTFAELVARDDPQAPAERLLLADPADQLSALRSALGVWAADGSLVVTRGQDQRALEALTAAEGVTRRA